MQTCSRVQRSATCWCLSRGRHSLLLLGPPPTPNSNFCHENNYVSALAEKRTFQHNKMITDDHLPSMNANVFFGSMIAFPAQEQRALLRICRDLRKCFSDVCLDIFLCALWRSSSLPKFLSQWSEWNVWSLLTWGFRRYGWLRTLNEQNLRKNLSVMP